MLTRLGIFRNQLHPQVVTKRSSFVDARMGNDPDHYELSFRTLSRTGPVRGKIYVLCPIVGQRATRFVPTAETVPHHAQLLRLAGGRRDSRIEIFDPNVPRFGVMRNVDDIYPRALKECLRDLIVHKRVSRDTPIYWYSGSLQYDGDQCLALVADELERMSREGNTAFSGTLTILRQQRR